MSFAEESIANNAKFAADMAGRPCAPTPPARAAAVVTCMDARIDPAAMLGLAEGDAHVIRNAGGVVTDDVIRSLLISQRLLGTREIVLIHHTDCGMAKFSDDEVKAGVEKDTGLRPPFALEAFRDVEEDVRQSIRRVEASPYLPAKDQVRGFVYDVESRRLVEVTA